MIKVLDGTIKEHHIAGMERQATELIEHAYDRGWQDGFEEAKRQAEQWAECGTYNKGFADGQKEGYSAGLAREIDEGHADIEYARQEGREIGYREGYRKATEIILKVLEERK